MLSRFAQTRRGRYRMLEHPDADAAALFEYFEEPPSEHRLIAKSIEDYPS
jgi:hypothetical protein